MLSRTVFGAYEEYKNLSSGSHSIIFTISLRLSESDYPRKSLHCAMISFATTVSSDTNTRARRSRENALRVASSSHFVILYYKTQFQLGCMINAGERIEADIATIAIKSINPLILSASVVNSSLRLLSRHSMTGRQLR